MAESTARCCLLLILILQIELSNAYTYGTDYMSDNCGQIIIMGSDSSRKLDSQTGLSYTNNQDCTVTIQTSFLRKIVITFERMSIEGFAPCTGDYLKVYDGPIPIGQLSTICGSTAPTSIASTFSSITLKFKTDSLFTAGGFLLVYTSFSTDSICLLSEFRCDNGRCIDNDLRNDFYDNCGDNSDEDFDEYVNNIIGWGIGLIVGVVVGSIALGILVCVCCGCLCYHLCCKPKPLRQTTVVMAATTQQPAGQQAYNGQQAQPPPQPPGYNQPQMAVQQQHGQQIGPYAVNT